MRRIALRRLQVYGETCKQLLANKLLATAAACCYFGALGVVAQERPATAAG